MTSANRRTVTRAVHHPRLLAAVVAGLAVAGATQRLQAATTYTYIGGASADVNAAGTWSPSGTPTSSSGDIAVFDSQSGGVLTLSNGGNVTTGSGSGVALQITSTSDLTIDSTAAIWRFNNAAVSIAAGTGAFSMGDGVGSAVLMNLGGSGGTTQTFTNNSSNTATINADVVFGPGGGGTHTMSIGGAGNWVLNNIVRNASDLSVSDGLFHITKTGAGTLTLNNNGNVYSGNTNINGGTVRATASNALGFAGQYSVGRAAGVTTVNGASAAATLDLAGASGNLTVNEPIVLNGGTNGASLINSSTTRTATLGSGIAAITLSSGGTTYGTSTGATSVTAQISGGGGSGAAASVLKGSSAGTSVAIIWLTNAGSGYTSAPTITLRGANGETGAVGNAILSSLTLTGTNNSIGGDGTLTIAAPIGESAAGGGFTKIGNGTTTLSGTSTYTGATDVKAGRLVVSGTLGGTAVTVEDGAVLQLSSATALGTGNVLSLIDPAGTTLVLDSNVSVGALLVNGVAQTPGAYSASTAPQGYESLESYFGGTGTLTVVPEPASWLAMTFVGLALPMRRRRRCKISHA